MAKSRRPKRQVKDVPIRTRTVVQPRLVDSVTSAEIEQIFADAARDGMGGTFEPTSRAMNTDEAMTSLGNALTEFGNALNTAALRVAGSPIRMLPLPEGSETFREYAAAMDARVREALRVPPEMMPAAPPMPPAPPTRAPAIKPLQPGAPTRVRRPLQLEDD